MEPNEPEQQPDEQTPEEAYVAELVDSDAQANEDPAPVAEAGEGPSIEGSSIIEAEVVPLASEPIGGTAKVVYSPTVASKPQPQYRSIAPPPSPLENLAAKGGAVGAIVLGTLALFGSFITSYAVLNSLLGLMMGVWGLNSSHKRMAGVGILLCLVAAFFCVVEISSLLPWLWQSDEF